MISFFLNSVNSFVTWRTKEKIPRNAYVVTSSVHMNYSGVDRKSCVSVIICPFACVFVCCVLETVLSSN